MLNEENEFQRKFVKLLDILANDKEKSYEFSSAETVEQSYNIACSFVGEMDFNLYNTAMKRFSKEFHKNAAKGEHAVTDGNLGKVAGGLGIDYNSSLFSQMDFVGDFSRFVMPLAQQYEAGSKLGAMMAKLF